MKYILPPLPLEEYNLDILEKFNENENIINKLLKIPKKLLTEEQAAEILERVHLRVELARQLRKK